jgi:hypothetical protein
VGLLKVIKLEDTEIIAAKPTKCYKRYEFHIQQKQFLLNTKYHEILRNKLIFEELNEVTIVSFGTEISFYIKLVIIYVQHTSSLEET